MAERVITAPGRYLRFPPQQRNVLVPLGPRRASAQALTLYAASKPRAVLALDALWAATRITGVRWLPGKREQWRPPMDDDTMADLTEQWTDAAGRRPDALAFYERIQPFRSALTVLLCAGRNSMLIRVRTDPSALQVERAVSRLDESAPTAAFRVPRHLGEGHAGDWHWVAYETMSRRPHAPARRASADVTDRISELVEQVVPRPAGTPAHWRGAHGDLSPWNLRRAAGDTWLIDWEDAEWAPPGADAVYHAAMTACLTRDPRGPLPVPDAHREAVRFWAGRIAARTAVNPAERTLNARLLAALATRP